jgi:hypothetical protein
MIIDRDNNICIITQEKLSIVQLVRKIEAEYSKYSNNHIIVNLTSLKPLFLEDIIEFLRISNTHRGDNKSFVLVSDKAGFDDMPDEIVVVPTIQEAHDIIEMEEIDRDLGF